MNDPWLQEKKSGRNLTLYRCITTVFFGDMRVYTRARAPLVLPSTKQFDPVKEPTFVSLVLMRWQSISPITPKFRSTLLLTLDEDLFQVCCSKRACMYARFLSLASARTHAHNKNTLFIRDNNKISMRTKFDNKVSSVANISGTSPPTCYVWCRFYVS